MLPTKRKYTTKASDKKTFADKAELLAEFQEHDLKLRSSAGKYTYYNCSRCQLRVGVMMAEDGIKCPVSVINVKCQLTATLQSETLEAKISEAKKLCSVCLQAECIYVCLPCMHKCTCAECAKQCKACPICRETATSWNTVFDAGVEGTVDDITNHVVNASYPATLLPASSDFRSDSSDSDYLPLRHHHAEPVQSEVEWIANQVYPPPWSIAALAARAGDRRLALLLLQSMDWKIRAGTLIRPMLNLLEMGFEEIPVRVCLLTHDGEERLALEVLLQGCCHVDEHGHFIETVD